MTVTMTINPKPATEAGALDGFEAVCSECGPCFALSLRCLTEQWARDHVRVCHPTTKETTTMETTTSKAHQVNRYEDEMAAAMMAECEMPNTTPAMNV